MLHRFVLLSVLYYPLLLNAQATAPTVTDIAARAPQNEAPRREADLLWEKQVWRTIDTRERINHGFRNARAPLISILLAGVESGQLQAYSAETDDFRYPLAAQDLLGQLSRQDTVTSYDPASGAASRQPVTTPFDPETVTHYRLMETWYFDRRESTQRVRILGIAPVVQERSPTGELLNERVLCWFNYPGIRGFLARQPVAVANNSMPPMSWEDLFEMRFFDSYITKEQNVPDEHRPDKSRGDRELQQRGGRIEQDIFNREQDVWEY